MMVCIRLVNKDESPDKATDSWASEEGKWHGPNDDKSWRVLPFSRLSWRWTVSVKLSLELLYVFGLRACAGSMIFDIMERRRRTLELFMGKRMWHTVKGYLIIFLHNMCRVHYETVRKQHTAPASVSIVVVFLFGWTGCCEGFRLDRFMICDKYQGLLCIASDGKFNV